jgi:hypothetical protein
MEPAGSGATWTGSPKGVFAERKHHKPRLALNNITAGVHEREDENGTRVVGHLDEIQGVIATHIKVAPSWGRRLHGLGRSDAGPQDSAQSPLSVF